MSASNRVRSHELRQRDYLLQISRALTAQLDLEEVLRLVITHAVEMVDGHMGMIALRDENERAFRIAASYGLPQTLLPRLRPFLNGLPAEFQPEHWRIPDLQVKLGLMAAELGIGLRQVVSLPLSVSDALTGVIYIFRSSGAAFSANDREVLQSFADQAAIAVRNARLYQTAVSEKQRLDALIDSSADGVLILDRTGRIEIFSRAVSELTGCPQDVALGRPCTEVLAIYNEQGVNLCAGVCPLLDPNQRSRASLDGTILRPDGRRVAVSITYSPIYDAAGYRVNTVANIRDITRAREAEELKSTLLSVISHELKTPVALIKGYAGTLRREDANWDRETLSQSLEIIEEESDRLNKLIDNLLEASRIQAGGLKLRFGYVRLDRLARKVAGEFRTQSAKHTIVEDFPEELPPVLGDEERLRQVVGNLLSNAIKYSPSGGTITVGGRADAGEVRLFVSDQGIGIAPGEQAKIFEHFYRVDNASTRKTQGAGLGLFLVKAVVEAHGGHIWVDSTLGKGSTFNVTLPRR
ncbi:MAG: PAS domain S-box protein [Chloroflexi bacterium]|nr:PAS domain S-box protein [Chloroflexota bacterium]